MKVVVAHKDTDTDMDVFCTIFLLCKADLVDLTSRHIHYRRNWGMHTLVRRSKARSLREPRKACLNHVGITVEDEGKAIGFVIRY